MQFAVMPHNYIFIGFYFSLPKRKTKARQITLERSNTQVVYLNALLAMLNARGRLRDGLTNEGAYSMPRPLNVGFPGRDTKHSTSFGAVNVAPATSACNGFRKGDKVCFNIIF